jgi:hypothetical protein
MKEKTMSNKSIRAALAAVLALVAVTAVSVTHAEPVPVEREKPMKSSDAPREAKRLPTSELPASGGAQDKSKELATGSKRRHDEAKKVIDNLKD